LGEQAGAMRPLYLAGLLFAACAGAVHADILANGDFTQGSAHWQGDRATNTDASTLTITLKPDTWTKIYQDFHSADAALKLHVSYELSPDCTFLPQNGMAQFFVSNQVVLDITGARVAMVNTIPIPVGGFLGVVSDPSKPLIFTAIMRGRVTGEIQDSEGFFYDLNPHAEKKFYLAFPPGNGTVTLTHIGLEAAPQGPTRDAN
jgi:hypothetical protein